MDVEIMNLGAFKGRQNINTSLPIGAEFQAVTSTQVYFYKDVFQITERFTSDFLFVTICLTFVIVFLGIFSNVINMVVFLKQGVGDNVNLSLFALAVSELCSLLPLVWHGFIAHTRFLGPDVDFVGSEVHFLTTGWPHTIFTKVTSWVTAFIMFERCLCIALPLKVKTVLTTTRVKLCLVSIFVLVLAGVVPTYATHSLGWKFYPALNRTLLGLKKTDNARDVTQISNLINNSISSFISYSVTLVCTTIIIFQLNKKTKWRETTAGSGDKGSNPVSARDRRAVKTVTIVSGIFLVRVTPSIVVVMATSIDDQFTLAGKYGNLLVLIYGIIFDLEALNSSVNILVYYKTNRRYRHTFKSLLFFSNVHSSAQKASLETMKITKT